MAEEVEEEDIIARLKREQITALTALTKQRTKLTKLMASKENLHEVKSELDIFNDKFERYIDAHSQYIEYLSEEEIQEKEEKRYEEREKSALDFRNQAVNWTLWAEDHLLTHDDSASRVGSRLSKASRYSKTSKSAVSKSSKLSKTSKTSKSSSITDIRARVAELLVERELLNERQRLKAAEEELALRTEIEKAKARERTFLGADQSINMETQNPFSGFLFTPASFERKAEITDTQSRLDPTAKEFKLPTFTEQNPLLKEETTKESKPIFSEQIPDENATPYNEVDTSRRMLAFQALQKQQHEEMMSSYQQFTAAVSLPQPKVPVFKGDIMEYMSFIMAFTTRIESRAINDADRLYYLNQQLEGEPKDLIEGCLYLEPSVGYAESRRLLREEYGDPYKIAMAYLKQVLDWPAIKQDDGTGLKKFSLFLVKCKNAMKNIEYLEVLNHTPNLKAIVGKMPYFLQNKWRDQVIALSKRVQKIPSFQDLVEFVTAAAESANHPIYGREAMQTETKQPLARSKNIERWPRHSAPKQKSSTFATEIQQRRNEVDVKIQRSTSGQREATVCIYCKDSHDIDDCEKFAKMTNQEKKNYLKENAMCFACYGTNHVTRGCTKKRTCKVCNKYGHPTALHIEGFTLSKKTKDDDTAKESSDINSLSVKMDGESIVLHTILPVKVKKKDCNETVLTYAFYDGGSGGCFATEDLKKQLDATGNETTLQLGTMHGKSTIKTTVLKDLIVTDLNNENAIELPRTFTRDFIPVSHQQIPKPEVVRRWNHLQEISEQVPEYRPNLKIGLLIGSNCPAAFEPLEVLPSQHEGPFAVRLRHGWTISTPLQMTTGSETKSMTSNRIAVQEIEDVKEIIAPETLLRMFELDFIDQASKYPNAQGYSQEDMQFLKIAEEGTRHVNGHYEVPLPFRQSSIRMPNNKEQAYKKATWLKGKFKNDDRYFADYKVFINDILQKGYAQKVPEENLLTEPGKSWYLPHHGVYHPHKPNKVRVVFNCSAKYNGVSLNSQLLQGPDLTNSLIGVLQRFRREPIAIMADIEAMFHQVRVPIQQCDFLRFLWWPDGNLEEELQEYQMLVHLFGATSSPSCSNYALKKSANDAETLYGSLAAETVRENFYVDDCLTSVDKEETAIQLIEDLRKICAYGGFRLTKFVCNRRNVLQTIPIQECASKLVSLDLGQDNLPTERALGVQWSVESDVFEFKIMLNDKPVTRRGILSTVSSIYDPLGFVAPIILPAKKILQSLCKEDNLGWDDEIPSEYQVQWEKWRKQLPQLDQVKVNRCYKPAGFGVIVSKQVHIFADASTIGYGSSAYLRLTDNKNQIHCTFLFGKARLAPIRKVTTIPRLELTAATLSVRIGQLLERELNVEQASITYHTDSTTVLRYIINEQKRFKVFVANRIQEIRDHTNPKQWRYVPSSDNPADDASRGLDTLALINGQRWLKGPDFLWKEEEEWPSQPFAINEIIPEDDPEVKHPTITSHATEIDDSANCIHKLFSYFSNWHKLKRTVFVFLQLKNLLKRKCATKNSNGNEEVKTKQDPKPTVIDVEDAEKAILKFVQSQHFGDEMDALSHEANNEKEVDTRSRGTVVKSSSIRRLDPFICQGLLHVGGRLRHAQIPDEAKYPIILPRKSHITTLIIRQAHEQLGHAGRAHVLAKLREKYWIIGANSATRQLIFKCVTCRRIQAPVSEQKMADLPNPRVHPAPPFTYVGLDYFGPFNVKDGRKLHKRYGVIFTCLACRAVHIELASSLDTDSCIQALRRFIARRGPVREIYSDNGTNFVGTDKELRQAIQEIDNKQIQEKLLHQGTDWKFNPPYASHMGGSWERQIRSIRKILSGLLKEHGDRMNQESLHTLMCEVEAIINSRPLTLLPSEPDDFNPLTPNQLLTMKTNIVGYPPGEFQHNDIYLKRRWRRVQYLANLFWSRWKKEYLITLQERPKWQQKKRNLRVNDIVLLKEDNVPRNTWSMGIVQETETDSKGYVRAVKIKTQASTLRRPISKLVVLLPSEEKET